MLQVEDAWFGYDEHRPVLKGVSLSIPAGSIVGILGPNGSGKTTLLRLLAGTRRPQRGRVTLDGAPIERTPRAQLAKRLAVVPQETQLAFDYSAAEVAMMGRFAHLGAFEIEGPRDVSIVDDALTATGTLPLKGRPFATLSGGEKQRVVIAAALAQLSGAGDTQSSYLLLDEPTASLDLAYQVEIAALLKRLHDGRRAGIVISTHDIGLAGTLCDTLLLLRDGVIVARGPVDAVLTPDALRRVYDVDADILRHPSGQLVVVPIRRLGDGARP